MSLIVTNREEVWSPERRRLGRGDAVAIAAWTAAVLFIFWDAASLQRALFYFDITEINYPYRDFFARELRAGRFSRWHPGLYCGLPLYSESQAGYLHPLKYLLYPFLPTWKAFNLDTVLSVWLTGLGTYGWLRRHVGAAGALAGASIFGLSGFVWAHLIHTSMTNALISVPLAFWALECAWDGGRIRGVALGAIAIACQVFAGHLQDTLLTGLALIAYGAYRATIERGRGPRSFAIGSALGMVALGGALSAVQWVPSKELLDRSPRAGGLTWAKMTYGSWHPELLPTLLVREAYGTRARDTDWMDGFYPYHEMNAYMGIIGLALAIVGATALRDRWVAFWVLLASLGGLLMLGRFTFLFDIIHRVPILGSSRIPVRFHLWVSLAVAALAAVGTDRLSRPGRVPLRACLAIMASLLLASIALMAYAYSPIWDDPNRWTTPYHRDRFHWLGVELAWAAGRNLALVLLAALAASAALRSRDPIRRRGIAAILPVLVIVDLLGAHYRDVPTVSPSYWTDPPVSARRIKADATAIRVIGEALRSAGEPGHATRRSSPTTERSMDPPVDFQAIRDDLAWSLPPVWGLSSAVGETPIYPSRMLAYTDNARIGRGRFDVEGVSHIVTYRSNLKGLSRREPAGSAYIYRNAGALPRARLMGKPIYARDQADAARIVADRDIRETLVVEDSSRPLPESADVSGTATIMADLPERVMVATESSTPSYLLLADTFDPGWSATLDGSAAPIRAADVAFRAVYVPEGRHHVEFTYSPAGFTTGLTITSLGTILALSCIAWPRRLTTLEAAHGDVGWPPRWPWQALAVVALIVLASTIQVGRGGVGIQERWSDRQHKFTWGAKVQAMNTGGIR